jgi:Ethanolamine utilization protein EutJ (predicted chaperonin)
MTESSLRYCCIFSGLPNVTDLTMLSGMTAVHDLDRGLNVDRQDRQTSSASGSFTIGYTSATDDVAMVAVAIQTLGRFYPFYSEGQTTVGLTVNASETAITRLRGGNFGATNLVLQLKSGANTYDLTLPTGGAKTELVLSPTIAITVEDSENWLGVIDSLTIRPA